MVNPLLPCFEWFLALGSLLPLPVINFLWLALALFFVASLFRWFL